MTGQAVDVLNLRMPERVVGILGMHRSGTSCLTGTLQQAGLFLDEVHTRNRHNKKGNRENQKFVDLHESILEANGAAWNRPPVGEVVWSDDHVAQGRALLAEHSGRQIFGFKDPRTLLMLDGWTRLYPDMEFVGIFRHPNAVVRSLQSRNSMSREQALHLWYVYNSLMYREYRRKPFPLLDFDLPEDVLDDQILRVAAKMGLRGRADEDKFFSANLKSASSMNRPLLPVKVWWLYRKLLKCAA